MGDRRRHVRVAVVTGARTMARRWSVGAALILLAVGCVSTGGASAPDFDPTGVYDITMAAQGLVSEGEMSIRGTPGSYRGVLAAGGISAEIRSVDVGTGNMNVRGETTGGSIVIRLVRDGDFFSGNWLYGDRRGTFTAQRRPSG